HVDFLKIDKELIDKTINEPITGYLLKSISELSLFRNIAIIGEGIDSPSKLRLINKIGFDYGQGYYLSKPKIPEHFLTKEKHFK
ncbi:EAL domain-containing protein, partial [Desulfothermus sp.]